MILQSALLGILRFAPMSGYELEEFIATSISHFWHAKLSQIYRTLKKMESDGLVTSLMQDQDGARSKRVYTITEKGIVEFDAWQATLSTELDEIKLPSLVQTFFMGEQASDVIEEQLSVWEQLHQNQLNHYKTVLPAMIAKMITEHEMESTEKQKFFWLSTLRFGIMYEEMVLTWLSELQDNLNSLPD